MSRALWLTSGIEMRRTKVRDVTRDPRWLSAGLGITPKFSFILLVRSPHQMQSRSNIIISYFCVDVVFEFVLTRILRRENCCVGSAKF